jgi:hypothetical protein
MPDACRTRRTFLSLYFQVLRTVLTQANGRFSISAPGGRYVLSITGVPSLNGFDFTEPVEIFDSRTTRWLLLILNAALLVTYLPVAHLLWLDPSRRVNCASCSLGVQLLET